MHHPQLLNGIELQGNKISSRYKTDGAQWEAFFGMPGGPDWCMISRNACTGGFSPSDFLPAEGLENKNQGSGLIKFDNALVDKCIMTHRSSLLLALRRFLTKVFAPSRLERYSLFHAVEDINSTAP